MGNEGVEMQLEDEEEKIEDADKDLNRKINDYEKLE